jgi:putative intracellular protease/amidase
VAILVTDGFAQVELTEPRKALDGAGADGVDQEAVVDQGHAPPSR